MFLSTIKVSNFSTVFSFWKESIRRIFTCNYWFVEYFYFFFLFWSKIKWLEAELVDKKSGFHWLIIYPNLQKILPLQKFKNQHEKIIFLCSLFFAHYYFLVEFQS